MNNSEDLFSKICRICLSVNNSRTVPLFDSIDVLSCYGQAVSSCSAIQLPHIEYAPNNMCYNCLHQLRQCIMFKKKCKNAINFFGKINSNISCKNAKENIIKQLYSNNVTLIDNKNIFQDKNNDNLGKDKEKIKAKSYVEILFEPLKSIDKKDKTKKKKNIKKPKLNNINDQIINDINKMIDEDNERDLPNDNNDTNDIYSGNDIAENDIDNDISSKENEIKESKPKVEIKTQLKKEQLENETTAGNSNNIFKQIEEISNDKGKEEKGINLNSKTAFEEEINTKNTESNSNLLEIEIDSCKSTVESKGTADLLLEAIGELLDNELLENKLFPKQSKKSQEETMENYKKTLKLIEHKNKNTLKFKTDRISLKIDKKDAKITKNNKIVSFTNEISKIENLKEDQIAMRYLKVSKDATVKFRHLNTDGKKVFKKKKKQEIRYIKKKPDFPCNTCGKSFKSKNSWLRHSERHAGISTFMCEQCGKGYVTKSELEVHTVLSHGTGKHYPCEICGYKAPKPYDLKEHMRIHTGERPYACDQCGLTFRRLYIMRQHQICHTEKKFQCPKCPLRFYKLTSLRDHDNNVHARRYMYACEMCSRQYARNKTVRQHLTKVHGVPRCEQGKIRRVFISETPLSQPPLEMATNIAHSQPMQ